MKDHDFPTEFENSAAAKTVAPSTADRWKSAHWFAEVAATGDAESESLGAAGCLCVMLGILPPAPAGRRAVFHSSRGSEVR
ncbi:hypothetical protein VSR34_27690 [Paraburkholderia sp. JHI2823]|uniref:hypothetical protein n=1 Tax=Paraburkholderia sp. JHI2823 TaxID=3112960 RepID=UPI0031823018